MNVIASLPSNPICWRMKLLFVSVPVASCLISISRYNRGPDEVLKLMRRRYDTALFASKIKIKEVMPDLFIGIDVIKVRGRNDWILKQAWSLYRKSDITQLHVFSYSERPGTQALKNNGGIARRKAPAKPTSAGSFRRKTQAFYASPYRTDDAGIDGKNRKSVSDAWIYRKLYPCGSRERRTLDNQVIAACSWLHLVR